MLSHIKSNDNQWTVVIDSQPHLFDSTHPEYEGLVESVKVGDTASFLQLITVGTLIENWSEGSFEFRDGLLYFEDEEIADQPTDRIIGLIRNGWSVGPMLAYLSNLYENVSRRAVQESYTWCSHKGLPITEDGMLIGYKGIAVYNGPDCLDKNGLALRDGDGVDKYTGRSYRNNVGDKPSMKRRTVCDDMTQGCAEGLHVGTYDYACGWAGPHGRVILVKFNPKDIVSVPSCCEFQKLRTCDYEVMAIAREQIEEAVWTEPLFGDFEDDEDDEDDMMDAFDDVFGPCDPYDDDNNQGCSSSSVAF